MTRIVLCGCSGAMGGNVIAAAAARSDCRIVAGIDRDPIAALPFPVYTNPTQIEEDFDAIIDFSTPKVLDNLLAFAVAHHKPIVIATTGFAEEQIMKIEDASSSIAIFFSANMSLGVSLLRELAVTAAKVLGVNYDIEIVEKHHNRKVDAPSGTALMLANAVSASLPYDPRYVYDRHSSRVKRDPHEIGIHSVRGGTIVGEHDVIFAGQDEVITLTHTAYSRTIFANGALAAAAFISTNPAGLYVMSDLVEQSDKGV